LADFIVGEPQNLEALASQHGVPFGVVRRLLGISMTRPIHLDLEPPREADEVEIVPRNGVWRRKWKPSARRRLSADQRITSGLVIALLNARAR
jgi:hypothetical protein